MFTGYDYSEQTECSACGRQSPLIASILSACADCIRERPAEVLPHIRKMQAETRREFDLPTEPPHDPQGVHCPLCANECRIPEGEQGFCGLRENRGGRLIHLAGTARKGILHWYYDPLPTNCVADWVCPGHTRYGYKNLAVFYGACLPAFEKLFAILDGKPTIISIGELVDRVLNPSAGDLSSCQCSVPMNSIKVAALDPESCTVKYANVTRVMRRPLVGKLLRITVDSGRRVHVTADHPMLVATAKGFAVKNAERVEIGDYIPIAKRLPPPLREQEPIIDLIAAFTELDLDHQIMVYGARRLLYKGTAPYRKLGVRKYLWDNWRRDDCMPLWVFNALDDRMVDRRRVNIGFRYSKRKDCLPAIISLNRPLAKLLGYYLSEGYATGGRVEFCVGIHEHDLAQEIASLIQEAFGVPIRMRINYWKGHPSSIRVDARNKTLEAVFRDVFQAGVDSYTKKVPWFVFALDEESIAELLNAYFIGDGHVRRSVSGGKTRNVLSIESSTASEDLALGFNCCYCGSEFKRASGIPQGERVTSWNFK